MTEKLQAIVIKSYDSKEKDKNILLFSIEKGKVWANLKGVKGSGAKMKLAKSLFCFGEFILEQGKTGLIVTGFSPIETFYEISSDINKYFEGTAILEVVNAIDFEGEAERAQVFMLILKALKSICFDNVKNLYCLDKFLIEIFKLEGYPLETEKCSCCGTKNFERAFMNYVDGEIECMSCRSIGSVELNKATVVALKLLKETPFDKLKTLKLAYESELGLLKVLTKNFEARFDKKVNFMGILS